jgi:hypothetical protein
MVAAIRLENGGILLGNGMESRLLQEFRILEEIANDFHLIGELRDSPIHRSAYVHAEFSLLEHDCVSFLEIGRFREKVDDVAFVDFLSVHVLESCELHEFERIVNLSVFATASDILPASDVHFVNVYVERSVLTYERVRVHLLIDVAVSAEFDFSVHGWVTYGK